MNDRTVETAVVSRVARGDYLPVFFASASSTFRISKTFIVGSKGLPANMRSPTFQVCQKLGPMACVRVSPIDPSGDPKVRQAASDSSGAPGGIRTPAPLIRSPETKDF